MEERDVTKFVPLVHEEAEPLVHEEADIGQYLNVPSNRPVLTLNDALVKVIKLGKLVELKVWSPEDKAHIHVTFLPFGAKKFKDSVSQYVEYGGAGDTLHDAITKLFAQLDKDYPDLPPEAA